MGRIDRSSNKSASIVWTKKYRCSENTAPFPLCALADCPQTRKKCWIAYVLWAFGGLIGMHRYYLCGVRGAIYSLIGASMADGLFLLGWVLAVPGPSGLPMYGASCELAGFSLAVLLVLKWLIDAALLPRLVRTVNLSITQNATRCQYCLNGHAIGVRGITSVEHENLGQSLFFIFGK